MGYNIKILKKNNVNFSTVSNKNKYFKQENYFQQLWVPIGLGQFAGIKIFFLQHQHKAAEG